MMMILVASLGQADHVAAACRAFKREHEDEIRPLSLKAHRPLGT